MRYREHLHILEDKLVHATEFADIMNYFFDHLSKNTAFHRESKPIKGRNIAIENAVANVLYTVSDRPVEGETKVSQHFVEMSEDTGIRLHLFTIPGAGFIHGTGCEEGRMITILYFEKRSKGLIALTSFDLKTEFYRVSISTTIGP